MAGDIEVKRDLAEQQRDEVRILTVHGAKGLEAPVVFLPDTMQLPDCQVRLLWSEADGCRCGGARRAGDAVLRDRAPGLRQRQLQEYRRLLYVALTRAQDRLYVCGWQNQRPAGGAVLACAVRSRLERHRRAGPIRYAAADRRARRLVGKGCAERAADRAPEARERATCGARRRALPAWALAPPPPEPSPPGRLLPSRPSGPEPATLSPLATAAATASSAASSCTGCCRACRNCRRDGRRGAAFLALPVHGSAREEQASSAAR
jgi:ATP-dependent helicase/nuclease subunit A